MNLNTIEQEVLDREHAANRLEGTILFLQAQPDHYKHEEALWLLEQELFYRHDQLSNYRILVNILKAEQPKEDDNESVPEK
jgi:hypothetical protein